MLRLSARARSGCVPANSPIDGRCYDDRVRALTLIGLFGCYSPSYRDCTIACDTTCPHGLYCVANTCRTSPSPPPCVDAGANGDARAVDAATDAPMQVCPNTY